MNLLYLQAEIHYLKTELDEETAADAACDEGQERYHWDYHWRALATSTERGVDGRRWEVWVKLKKVLYEYRACLPFLRF